MNQAHTDPNLVQEVILLMSLRWPPIADRAVRAGDIILAGECNRVNNAWTVGKYTCFAPRGHRHDWRCECKDFQHSAPQIGPHRVKRCKHLTAIAMHRWLSQRSKEIWRQQEPARSAARRAEATSKQQADIAEAEARRRRGEETRAAFNRARQASQEQWYLAALETAGLEHSEMEV